MNTQKKRFLSIVSVALGVTILTASAFANYDNSNGYSTLKNAVKKLVLNPPENYTVSSTQITQLDGKEISNDVIKIKSEGEKSSSVDVSKNDGESYTTESYTDGKTNYSYDPAEKTYSMYESIGNSRSLMGFGSADTEEDKEYAEKGVRFAELLGDAVVGDLKNSVVLKSQTNGVRQYAIDLSQNQIPELIKTGLSLLQGHGDGNVESSYVIFEDTAVYESDDCDAQLEKYYKILEDEYNDKGILYVKKDGTTQYCATDAEYQKAAGYGSETVSLNEAYGSDVAIQHISGTGTVDKDGNLTAGTAEVTLASTGTDGKAHEIVFKYAFTLSDIGSTKADTFDPTGKTKINDQEVVSDMTTDEGNNTPTEAPADEQTDAVAPTTATTGKVA